MEKIEMAVEDVLEELTFNEIDEVSGGLYQGSDKGGDNPLHGS